MRAWSVRIHQASVAVLVACNSGSTNVANPTRGDVTSAPVVEVISCVDLPRSDPLSHNLSGLAWDPSERRLYAVSDRDRWITVIEPRPDFAGFDIRASITLDIDVDPWDGEALAIAGDRFLVVANETKQAIFSVDRSGRGTAPVVVPHLHGVRHNRGLESLGYVASPQGRYVFTVNEQALEGDGPTSTIARGTLVRITRHPLDGGDDVQAAYLTDPVFAEGQGENGVSDIAPLSSDRLLLLERGYVTDKGNAIRVYEVALRRAQDVTALGDARTAAPVAKRLIVDLALASSVPCSSPPQSQRRPVLENYEGMALGPTLEDGRRLLFMISDDNRRRSSQVSRLITVALAPSAL